MPPNALKERAIDTTCEYEEDHTITSNQQIDYLKAQQKKLPTDLVEVCRHLPKDIFQIRPFRAYLAAFQAVGMTALSLYLLTFCHSWWSLCIGWAFAGTCATGMFIIGHECAHGAFSKSSLENAFVGTIVMAPLGWTYHGWRITHNHHHAYTNQINKDHLWSPLDHEMVANTSNAVLKVLEYFYVGPLFFESSILHHFANLNIFIFPKRHWKNLISSNLFALAATLGLWYHFYYNLDNGDSGWWAVFKYWGAPYLCFNFWLSTHTYFHHKSRDIGWIEKANWNKAQAQLFHTAHVDYHPIVEMLHFDINWHVPHHVSTRIPWYNLRRATFALIKAYGDKIHTYEMSPTYWMEVTSECHVHDDVSKYVSVGESKERSEREKQIASMEARKTKTN
ncbi:hypothetical protein SARC_05203 [Sphaeroforma arctica JP610]|uniref:Fatty acid desaturase domain-containing protein n=1 Tax=Sphaeroforma arctica JP610 TaxID=667725 RepID=A0A0L0G2T1_9EUKA|nr:hypothetical protein SARC_05203 [Sphaeroforma arctica JP610]KNC82503.1 hypothetical protein SARC_05203 [Sphaeroforma arctica JP610]|eukprot:XP_014156405.1 hypothetical protein SARC_05203 [Sphaeroforma arctica JP610]